MYYCVISFCGVCSAHSDTRKAFSPSPEVILHHLYFHHCTPVGNLSPAIGAV